MGVYAVDIDADELIITYDLLQATAARSPAWNWVILVERRCCTSTTIQARVSRSG